MKRKHQQDVSMRAPSVTMWKRTLVLLTAVVLCFTAVGGRLVVLQLVEHGAWQALASDQQLTDSVISDKRGAILDRNGVVLARSVEVATVLMEPGKIPDEAARAVICRDLPTLLGVDADKLARQVAKTSSRYEVVKAKIDTDLRDAFIEWVKRQGLTGVFRVIQDYKREYPLSNTLSCVIGFTGTDNTGLEGLEAKYNEELAGSAGRVITSANGRGDAFPNELRYETTLAAGEGNTLQLTVDVNIQRIVENHLEVALAETGAANRTCAVVVDVRTGEILAMATKGDYDLNHPRTVSNPDTAAQIALLSGNEKSEAYLAALQKQWKNKVVSDFYEPGSVFKIFTASMAMQEGLISEQSSFYCNGTYTMAGVRTMKCHVYPRSHGSQTLAEAISHSCNPAFMSIGSLIGTTLFPRYHALFGFTEPTGIDMLGEARVTASLYHRADTITAVDVATSSIGQTFKVTPIQMITGVSSVAGGGELLQPYVVSRVLSPDGTVLRQAERTVRRRVISESVASRICALLEGVVDGGGAKNAYVAGYRVAGKTGTSEKTDQGLAANGRKNVVASFCGFAPADDPQIAVLVMVDEPQTSIRYGGTLAAPVAQKIFADVLPYWGVSPRYTEEEQKELQATVPAVTEVSVTRAGVLLQQQGLTVRVVGDGGQVTGQMPPAGESIARGGTVVVYTDGAKPTQVTVPSVVGRSLFDANRLLTNAGLNVKIVGYPIEHTAEPVARQAVVNRQGTEAGSLVSEGTVVEIGMVYQDATE